VGQAAPLRAAPGCDGSDGAVAGKYVFTTRSLFFRGALSTHGGRRLGITELGTALPLVT
jgi:hypothetical protein